jgi:hypothetical protein
MLKAPHSKSVGWPVTDASLIYHRPWIVAADSLLRSIGRCYVISVLFPLRWRQTGETDQVIISHNVTNYEFFYEPFYVSKDNAPPHDERFVGYGFTRNTQVSDRRQVATNLLYVSASLLQESNGCAFRCTR